MSMISSSLKALLDAATQNDKENTEKCTRKMLKTSCNLLTYVIWPTQSNKKNIFLEYDCCKLNIICQLSATLFILSSG